MERGEAHSPAPPRAGQISGCCTGHEPLPTPRIEHKSLHGEEAQCFCCVWREG